MTGLPPILFEDDCLVAFDKPSGLLVAPDRWDKSRENMMQLVHSKFSKSCYNAHRLDRETSGVLLCAKNKGVLKVLCGLFEAGKVSKQYVALTRGLPAEKTGRIDLPLVPDRNRPGRMFPLPGHGKPATTMYEVVESWRGFTLVHAFPITGRTHQIRVHLASIHTPIVGDSFYGDGLGLALSEIKRKYKQKKDTPEIPLIGRLALHSSKLSFAHPVTGQPVTIESPLPDKFEIAIKYLRRFAGW